MPNLQGLFPGDSGYVQTPTPQMGTDITSPTTPTTTSTAPTGSQTVIPPDATLISGPSGLQGLTENQIYRDPNSSNIYKLKVADKPANLDVKNNDIGLIDSPGPDKSILVDGVQKNTPIAYNDIERRILELAAEQSRKDEQSKIDAQSEKDLAMAGLSRASGAADPTNRLIEEAGINEQRKQLRDIQSQINLFRGALEQGLINIEGQPIAMEFVVGQQALLQRQAAGKINTLIAAASLVQNDINSAIETVKMHFQWAERDNDNQVKMYERLVDMASDKLIRLDAKESKFIDMQISILEKADDRQRADKDKVLDLMKSNPDAFKKANFSLDQPYEEILKAMLPYLQNQDEKKLVNDLATKYADAGITLSDTLAQAQAKLAKSKIYKEQVRPPVGSGGGSLTDNPAIDFYVNDFRASGLSFSDWVSGLGLDTATKNAIAKKLASAPSTVPPTTQPLDLNGNQILGQDLDTGQQITTANIQDIISQKEIALAQARKMYQENGSVMFQTRINELENDLVGLRQAMSGEQLTQG